MLGFKKEEGSFLLRTQQEPEQEPIPESYFSPHQGHLGWVLAGASRPPFSLPTPEPFPRQLTQQEPARGAIGLAKSSSLRQVLARAAYRQLASTLARWPSTRADINLTNRLLSNRCLQGLAPSTLVSFQRCPEERSPGQPRKPTNIEGARRCKHGLLSRRFVRLISTRVDGHRYMVKQSWGENP